MPPCFLAELSDDRRRVSGTLSVRWHWAAYCMPLQVVVAAVQPRGNNAKKIRVPRFRATSGKAARSVETTKQGVD